MCFKLQRYKKILNRLKRIFIKNCTFFCNFARNFEGNEWYATAFLAQYYDLHNGFALCNGFCGNSTHQIGRKGSRC